MIKEIVSSTAVRDRSKGSPDDFKYEVRVLNWTERQFPTYYCDDILIAMDYADKLCLKHNVQIEVNLTTGAEQSLEYEVSPITPYMEYDMAHREAYYALPRSQQLPEYF